MVTSHQDEKAALGAGDPGDTETMPRLSARSTSQRHAPSKFVPLASRILETSLAFQSHLLPGWELSHFQRRPRVGAGL
jgi:hypothetical protein